MTDQADQLQIPVLAAEPGGFLRAVRSRYGDYCDFELLWPVPRSDGHDVVGVISGYACMTRLVLKNSDAGLQDGYAVLVVGNTTVFLPAEHAEPLAAFLGIELMQEQRQE